MKLEKIIQNRKENRNITQKKINNNILMEILCVFNQIILDNMKIYDFSNNYKINGRFENVLFINF